MVRLRMAITSMSTADARQKLGRKPQASDPSILLWV